MEVKRSDIQLKANPKRVILRFLELNPERTEKLVKRTLAIPPDQIGNLYDEIQINFGNRHQNSNYFFLKHFHKISHLIPNQHLLTEKRKLVIGAHFTMEYSVQAAALFNPSIVLHPDQSNLKSGEIRFIMSLRSVGEGHISSIEFRLGTINEAGQILMDEVSPFSSTPEIIPLDLGKGIDALLENPGKAMDYNLDFNEEIPLSEMVIFPSVAIESKGMEDVRFVLFSEPGSSPLYVGTYTAYDGRNILPRLIVTEDFNHFEVRTMLGKVVNDKGFALFPEKINGRYAMIARQGGEDITIMFSDDLYHWDDYEIIMSPEHQWGLVQIGNCGSPLKTKDGWLLITHAVGPVRKYVISSILLDLDQPQKIIAKLSKPIISPLESEREGYVPNVVYTCGAIIYNENLIIPYAMSDSAISFATVSLPELLEELKENK